MPIGAWRRLSAQTNGVWSGLVNRLSVVVLRLLAALAFVSANYAQTAGYRISVARAAAIHECSILAAKYLDHTWGNREIYEYRACMVTHGHKP
jgi:hypothetical protein